MLFQRIRQKDASAPWPGGHSVLHDQPGSTFSHENHGFACASNCWVEKYVYSLYHFLFFYKSMQFHGTFEIFQTPASHSERSSDDRKSNASTVPSQIVGQEIQKLQKVNINHRYPEVSNIFTVDARLILHKLAQYATLGPELSDIVPKKPTPSRMYPPEFCRIAL